MKNEKHNTTQLHTRAMVAVHSTREKKEHREKSEAIARFEAENVNNTKSDTRINRYDRCFEKSYHLN